MLAQAALAYEDAAGHYGCALEALGVAEHASRERWELTMELGATCIRAGENDRGRRAFAQAAELARSLGDPECLALAALGYGSAHGSGVGVEWGVPDAALVALLEEALAGLPLLDGAVRARVMARLAVALYFVNDGRRKDELSAQASEMAARIGDIPTLAVTLAACRGALWGTEDLDRRLAATGEIARLAEQLGDRELRLQGHFWGVLDFAEYGDIAAVDRELERFTAIAQEIRQPVYLWYVELFGATRRLLAWDLEGRRSHIRAAVDIGVRMEDPNVVQGAAVQLLYLRREQGRIAEMQETIAGLARQYSAVPGWWGLLAFLHAELGRREEARAALQRIADASFSTLPRDANWLPSMAYVAEACALLEDARWADMLYALLEPYADRNVIVGPAVVCLGSLSRQLGMLAATAGRLERFEAHFDAALRANTAMGARAFLARTRYDYARALLRAGPPDAKHHALELLERSLDAAEELKMPRLSQQARELAGEYRASRYTEPLAENQI